VSIRAGSIALLVLVTAVCLGAAVVAPVRAPVISPVGAQVQDGAALFREDVQPLLEAQCFECLIDLDAHGGQVLIRENTFDEALDETRFSDGERPDHTDLFLEHKGGSVLGSPG
jgi:hypothetical protein